MPDARTRRTDATVKAALLELLDAKPLADISMAELAKRANVSRSTLYGHFGNVNDVFESLTRDFFENVRGLRTQLMCSDCETGAQGGKRPFCMALRAAGPYQSLVMAPEFLPTYLQCILNGPQGDAALEPYRATGATEAQARALFTFQMTGCYAAATMAGDIAWNDNQQAIDQFIRGGFAALGSMRHKD